MGGWDGINRSDIHKQGALRIDVLSRQDDSSLGSTKTILDTVKATS